jgi:hypothetical protein
MWFEMKNGRTPTINFRISKKMDREIKEIIDKRKPLSTTRSSIGKFGLELAIKRLKRKKVELEDWRIGGMNSEAFGLAPLTSLDRVDSALLGLLKQGLVRAFIVDDDIRFMLATDHERSFLKKHPNADEIDADVFELICRRAHFDDAVEREWDTFANEWSTWPT